MIDIVIIILLLLGLFVGMTRGFTRQLVETVGTIVVVVISFIFKGYLSNFFYATLPFFNFSGRFEGLTALNLLLYEAIAFLVIFTLLSGILKILKMTTTIFEKLLNATFILGIPSKILGAIVGGINNLMFIFVGLYFLSLPVFGMTVITDSSVANTILYNTPVLTNLSSKHLDFFEDLDSLLEEYKNEADTDELNQHTLELLVSSNIVSASTVNNLIDKGKLKNLEKIK